MRIEYLLLIIIIVSNISMLAMIPLRKYLRNVSIFFTLSIIFNVLWTLGDLLMLSSVNDFMFKLGSLLFLIAPMYSALMLMMFAYTYPNNTTVKGKLFFAWFVPLIFISLPIALNIWPPINSYDLTSSPTTFMINFNYYLIYALTLLVYFGNVSLVLIRKMRKSVGVEKIQIKYLLYATGTTSFLAMFTNLFLPLIGYTQFIWLGPLFSVAYIILIPFTISRYRLFDIKNITVRGLSYVASLVVVAMLAAITVYAFLSNFSFANYSNTVQSNILIFGVIFFAILFQLVKNFFDNLTKQLYFKRQLQSQDLLNLINDMLVKANDPKILLDKISGILREGTSAEFCNFFIEPDAKIDTHVAGTDLKLFNSDAWKQIENRLKIFNGSFLHSESTETDQDTKALMRSLDLDLIIKMEANNDSVGFLILGERTNGDPYFITEIQTLEVIADEVAITLQSLLRFEEIARFNVTLQKEVQDATSELKSSNEKLMSLDEAKDDFISMASHQLRTPLTSIKGYISMILEGDTGDINEQQRNFLNQAFISSQRMVFLISDLLNVSRLKTGKFVIEKTEVYLPDIVETEIDQLNSTAEARGLKLVYNKPSDYPKLMLDETKTHQVIMNFIDNAIFYSPKGGDINIELKSTDKMASLTVTDHGIGVPKKAQHELFTKFYRADNAKKARPDGTGLGLYMAKKVIIAQGGHLIFKSEEGKGSTFGFSFPVKSD